MPMNYPWNRAWTAHEIVDDFLNYLGLVCDKVICEQSYIFPIEWF